MGAGGSSGKHYGCIRRRPAPRCRSLSREGSGAGELGRLRVARDVERERGVRDAVGEAPAHQRARCAVEARARRPPPQLPWWQRLPPRGRGRCRVL